MAGKHPPGLENYLLERRPASAGDLVSDGRGGADRRSTPGLPKRQRWLGKEHRHGRYAYAEGEGSSGREEIGHQRNNHRQSYLIHAGRVSGKDNHGKSAKTAAAQQFSKVQRSFQQRGRLSACVAVCKWRLPTIFPAKERILHAYYV